jgi:hypothetical protein
MAQDVTRNIMSLEHPGILPDLHFFQPTLMTDAPLYLYDVSAKELEPTKWLTVKVAADTCLGTLHRLIDVVHYSAIEEWAERYRRATEAMANDLHGSGPGLRLYATGLLDTIKTEKRPDYGAPLAMNDHLRGFRDRI